MAARRTATEQLTAPKLQLSPAAIQRGIERLGQRIDELRTFDVATVPRGDSPELTALSAAIKDTIERCFGENSSAFRRFEDAASLSWYPMVMSLDYDTPAHEYRAGVTRRIERSIALLQEAQRALNEDLADAQHEVTALPVPTIPKATSLSQRVFIVHGHDGEARELVAGFLRKLGFDPVILHEQANRGGTVIEKIEVNRDVGFAVVLLTPDDEGRSVKEAELKPRARQNVLLELGYFICHLGRDKVCALKRGNVDIPSDFAGVVWENMDDGGGWRLALARELKAAGHEVDLNLAF
ncbi:TIR domain-containing protein [Paraburkholderia sp. RL17-373-BIF-A]|uniref:TIR domain-containing protein n=1 Tax=Paraburkholderia sp. RL17-373-BIF-A TaxID=3031629 RepID=UPI0038B6FB54